MEDLNNRQMILLTMFTSFVISIATGIITVAMLQAAPETITQTVNHVVEHTIERIVTGTSTPTEQPSVVTNNVTKEVTVYAKEDDLVVSAVEKNQPRIASIYKSIDDVGNDPSAIGLVASRDGLIISATDALIGDGTPEESYYVLIGGKGYNATPVTGQDTAKTLFFLKLSMQSATSSLDAVSYGRSQPKLAQTIVLLGGKDGTGVFKANVSKLRYTKPDATSTSQTLSYIETSPKIPDQNVGALVVDLDAQLLGVVVPDPIDATRSVIFPISRILESISAIPAQSSDSGKPTSSGG